MSQKQSPASPDTQTCKKTVSFTIPLPTVQTPYKLHRTTHASVWSGAGSMFSGQKGGKVGLNRFYNATLTVSGWTRVHQIALSRIDLGQT